MSNKEMPLTSGNVISADGTAIGYLTLGSGPALVIVHGTFREAGNYETLARTLSTSFTVYVLNRRGRGSSGPQGPDYGLHKEREDLVALLQKTGSELLFGHSYGGLVALETAISYPLKKVAVYEPPISTDMFSIKWIPAYESALAERNYGKALQLFFKGLSTQDIPDDHLEAFGHITEQPEWSSMARLLPSLPNEVRSAYQAASGLKRYEAISAETLMMSGSESTVFNQAATVREFGKLIHRLHYIVLPGLEHNAPDMHAPEQIASQLTRFFLE
ncbi:alpha/beta fold hydrolase [Cohnella zeiphila]|uniref:Alpha/beta hydrolase n=1 Tax=Cohnella zeiphila TaxID=2761120 RepID=A0A7X0VWS0_9BACL|nr:alpha/beta hydrolase [Cohnella zeiphila]MBB6732697.1 alpha/beta hydrolase [Cohnella zeiphila]